MGTYDYLDQCCMLCDDVGFSVMIVIHMAEFNNLITTNCMLGLTGIFKLIFFA